MVHNVKIGMRDGDMIPRKFTEVFVRQILGMGMKYIQMKGICRAKNWLSATASISSLVYTSWENI